MGETNSRQTFKTHQPSGLRRPLGMLTVVVLLGALALLVSGVWIWWVLGRGPLH